MLLLKSNNVYKVRLNNAANAL